MNRVVRVAVPVTALLLALAAGARAADTKAVLAEIEAHDKAFLAAYENGETKKMKSEIGKAVALGEKNGLGSDPAMADTYVLAAILEVDGNDNAKAGVRDFVKALKLRPDVAIPKGMATSPVKRALKQARDELGETPARADKTEKVTQEKSAHKEREKADKQEAADEAAEKSRSDAQADQEQANLAKDKAEGRARQLEKDRADTSKQLADAKGRIQQLEKDKADTSKQLADAKGRIQQLEKDKADTGKQLADARSQEGKERGALDKIARDKQAAEAQARDAENKTKQEDQERERLLAGPEMPGNLREALTCAVPDEAPLHTDLFVHCVARPNIKAKSIVFYYRTGGAHYDRVPMERTAKGWYAAIVPGVKVVGKVLQYYAEALDGREAVVATNGKETSPNILTLRPGGPRG